LVWILTLLGLAAVVGAILFAAIKLGDAQSNVSVPNVVLKKVDIATTEIKNAHLKPSVTRITDAHVPVDVVVRQNPVAGKDVSRDSTVTLFVSAGPATKQIPADITNGRPADEVTLELEALGFVVTPQQQSNAAPPGTVFDSTPKPGTLAPVGSKVTILVSSGPAPVAVPQVQNLTVDDATNQLEASGFTHLNTPIEENSTSIPAGQVTRTDPPAGKVVPLDTRITIYISRGAPTVSLPSVIGETQAKAKSDLEARGFTVSTLNRVDDANVGRVVDQSPAPGTQVAPNSNVLITIGIASTPSTTARTTTTT
jgi:serine/threonine-protein kinase